MENYTSSDSDSESLNKVLDFTHQLLEMETLEDNLEVFVNDEKRTAEEIETIILNHNHLETLPFNLFKFVNLKTLDVSYSGLSVLPDIFKHTSITTFVAKNNHLSNKSLPKTFTINAKVREVNLSGNAFSAFPEQLLDFPNLKYLYLGSNQITAIPRKIKKLKSLNVLCMGGNWLVDVPETVGELVNLQALVLCDNRIDTLPPSIARLKHLKSLLLHKNLLKALPPEIVGLKNLNELSLRDNPLVVRFVSDMMHDPGSLLELAGRTIKIYGIEVKPGDIPQTLISYLEHAHRCVNPQCKGNVNFSSFPF
uniref:Leucine-rich repeat-containing protein 58 n=1 Tax=Photinus pyralis TaxID=7054 RepID=A0A1Y1KD88_PHOPY